MEININPQTVATNQIWRACNTLIWDQIIHNTPLYAMGTSKFVDALWNFQNHSFIPWLISNPNSRFIIPQIFSGLTNLHRYDVNKKISIADHFLSDFISSAICDSKTFSRKNSNKRIVKRMLLTCEQNGGSYKEIGTLIKTLVQQSKSLSKIPMNMPYTKLSSLKFTSHEYEGEMVDIIINKANEFASKKEREEKSTIQKNLDYIFTKELHTSIANQFDILDQTPSNVTHRSVSFKGVLKNGVPVTLTAVLPNKYRMEIINTFPIQLATFFLDILPFTGSIVGFERALYDRVHFTLKDEVKARKLLLSKLGAKVCGSAETISESVNKLDFPIYIPAPIPKLCSKHIMVTTKAPTKVPKHLSKEMAASVIEGTTKAMMDFGIILPDVSPSNCRIENNKIALDRFSGCKEITRTEIKGISQFIAATAMDDDSLLRKAASTLSIKPSKMKAIKEFKTPASLLPLFKNHGPATLGSIEMMSGNIANARNAAAKGDIFKPLASAISSKINVNAENEIIDFFNEKITCQYE